MSVDLRLGIPAGVAWIAVGVLLSWPSALLPVAIAVWVLALALCGAAVLFRLRRQLIAGLIIVAAATGLVVGAAALQLPQRQPALLVEAASAGRFVTAVAVTTQTLHPGDARFAATLGTVTVGGHAQTASVPVTVFGSVQQRGGSSGSSGGRTVGIGTTIALSGTLSATEPGETSAFLFFAKGEAKVTAPPPWFFDWANELRAGFQDAASSLPGDGGALLPGLAIGDTSAVSLGLNTAMKASSLSHLTAVSGANCAVIIGLIMLAGGALGIPRGLRIAASVIVLAGFVVLVTPQPSVLRAAVMAVLVLSALASGRPARGIPVLALAVLALLVVDPWLARSYGFILSVLATGGLLILARPLTTLLMRWLPTAFAAVIAIPLAAQLACQPVLILLNPSIPLYAVPANVLAEPAAPVATVLGLVACVILPWSPALGGVVAQLAWVLSSWIAAVARFFVGLPGSSIPWLSGAGGVALIAVITLASLLIALRGGDRKRRWHRLVSAALALTIVSYLGLQGGEQLRQGIARPQDWQIAACDIGQGDAVLVRSQSKIALIDTGPNPALLHRCLQLLGINRIDLLVLTHYDLDHVGGTAAVLGIVDRAMIGPAADSHDARLAQQVRDGGAEVDQVSRGLTGTLGELRWEVLWPPERLGVVQPGNDASVTLEFSGVGECAGGCLSALFLGDLGEEPQARMMAANRQLGQVDVVKVAHHGSADQNPRLYDKLEATVGIISVGADNSYGHPTDKLLAMLVHAGTRAERTDRGGMILVSPRSDGSLSVWTEK